MDFSGPPVNLDERGGSMSEKLETAKKAVAAFIRDPFGHLMSASVWIVAFIMGWLIFRTIATSALQLIGVI